MALSKSQMIKRWDGMYMRLQERVTRQKEAIERLLRAQTLATAALMEIAEGDGDSLQCRLVARKALGDIHDLLATAEPQEAEE